MRIKSRYALAGLVAGSAALVGGLALPASATPPGDTSVTFDITGGSLSVTPQDTASLGDNAAGTTDVSGQLGVVTVTDDRNGSLGWTVTASSTEFSGTMAGNTGAASTEVDYTSGALDNSTSVGASTVHSDGQVQIDNGAADVADATAVDGDNVATWDPTLDVTMPADALSDTYSGTVTTSVS
jgi:hypothetical protein